MNPKQIWANLGVKNVAVTRDFYIKLGFKLNEGHDNGDELASFLFGEDNFTVHFFPNESLAKSFNGHLADLSKGSEIMFSLWADNREDADKWSEEVRNAGGTILSEPIEFGKGYYGFTFADPDGHKWNVFNCKR